MNFCPNCGTKLTESAKFCSNCGFNLQSIEVETPVTVADTPELEVTPPRNAGKQASRHDEPQTTETHHVEHAQRKRNPDEIQSLLEKRYAEQLANPKTKLTCAVDGKKIPFFSTVETLKDGYPVCGEHYHRVFDGYPGKNASLPTFLEFLELMNNPQHKPCVPEDDWKTEIDELHTPEKIAQLQENMDKMLKYSHELLTKKDFRFCAVDGKHEGRTFELADGYYVCEPHWDKVYYGKPEKGDSVPDLVTFLIKLDDPKHKKERLPEAQARVDALTAKVQAIQQRDIRSPRSTTTTTTTSQSVQAPKEKKYFGGLRCPRCKSANILLITDDANVKKIKRSTSINLNPLHPLTMMNHHEKVIKKHSGAKIAAGLMTGGASLLVTGTHSNAAHQYHCQDCGKVWTAK